MTHRNNDAGTVAWKVVEMAPGAKMVVTSQLWTARDFNFTRDPIDAVSRSMQSAVDGFGAHAASKRGGACVHVRGYTPAIYTDIGNDAAKALAALALNSKSTLRLSAFGCPHPKKTLDRR